MTLSEYAFHGREFKTVSMPFNLCCSSCNIYIQKGELAKRYDGATYVHEVCPNTPHKTFAPHKYGDAR